MQVFVLDRGLGVHFLVHISSGSSSSQLFSTYLIFFIELVATKSGEIYPPDSDFFKYLKIINCSLELKLSRPKYMTFSRLLKYFCEEIKNTINWMALLLHFPTTDLMKKIKRVKALIKLGLMQVDKHKFYSKYWIHPTI